MAWLPVGGDALTFIAGLMRAPFWLCVSLRTRFRACEGGAEGEAGLKSVLLICSAAVSIPAGRDPLLTPSVPRACSRPGRIALRPTSG